MKSYRMASFKVFFLKGQSNPAKPNAKAFRRSRIGESLILLIAVIFLPAAAGAQPLFGQRVEEKPPVLKRSPLRPFNPNIAVTTPQVPATAVEVINCAKIIKESNLCPKEQCEYGCFTPTEEGCMMACIDKLCWDIDPEDCPLNRCQVMISCESKDICYPKQPKEFGSCGGMGYVGQDVPCCEGFIKRCGVEFFDGSCDKFGRNSIYSIPACIPCGNGICDQFEQECNCPEDCARYGP